MCTVFNNQKKYRSLSSSGEITAGDDVFEEQTTPLPHNRCSNSNWHICLSYGISILLTIALVRQSVLLNPADDNSTKISGHGLHLDLYSPLRDSVQYETVRFNMGLWHQSTIYMGTPNNETEKAWNDLVRHGITALEPEEAKRLPDPTVPYMLNGKQYYIGAIEMWHQLHCLNMIRKAIWAEEPFIFYGKENTQIEEVNHIDHCIDYLRQVLTCHGDIGIIGFRYNETKHDYQPNFNSTHTCKKYEPLRQWADLHQAGDNTPEGVNMHD